MKGISSKSGIFEDLRATNRKKKAMYIKNKDTICAPATVPGTGAISVIRVSGPEALNIADKVISCRKGSISQAAGYTIKFGNIFDDKGTVLDEVLVSIFRAPYSYTGENSVEISCHASSYIVSISFCLSSIIFLIGPNKNFFPK